MGVEMDPELSSYVREEMPEKFPDNGIEFILKPGSVLFVPRGSWHRTEATSDALSLNFTFTAPCWIDLFITALRGRLAQSPNWRETADFVTDEELNIKAKEKLDSLLVDLVQDAPSWKAEDIINAIEMGGPVDESL